MIILIIYLISYILSVTPDLAAEEQYYRGVFDICVQQTYEMYRKYDSDFCLGKLRKIKEADWYGKPSVEEWQWPLRSLGKTG